MIPINNSSIQINTDNNIIDLHNKSKFIIEVFKNHFSRSYKSIPERYTYDILKYIFLNYRENEIVDINILTSDFIKIKKVDISEENLVRGVMKICLFQLQLEGLIDLSYSNIDYLTRSSNILSLFFDKVYKSNAINKNLEGVNLRFLLPLMLKNRILDINKVTYEMIKEFREFSLDGFITSRKNSKTKFATQYIYTLHRNLFFLGIIKEQPIVPKENDAIKNEDYFKEISKELKKSIIWYLDNLNTKKRNIAKHRIYLLHFAKFIQEQYPSISMENYNDFIIESYIKRLSYEVDNNIITKKWAGNCCIRINAFLNFLVEHEYEHSPKFKNLCNITKNIFIDFEDRFKSSRTDIPENIIMKILNKAKEIGEYEWSIIKVYEGTGMRINELGVLKMEDIHKDAKNLIKTNLDIRDDICWIKVTSPKIKDKERIVFIDYETYEAFEFLKKYRYEKHGNPPPMLNPANKQLGKNNYLILNSYGLPYKDISGEIGKILKKINIKDDDGNEINITTHQFRHTRATTLTLHGCPIHFAMQDLGHESPEMYRVYEHSKEDVQDITFNNLINDNFKVEVNIDDKVTIVTGEEINELHYINRKYYRRGGFCIQDEFQEDCSNIDCIECPIDKYSSNIYFEKELKESMMYYLEEWNKQEIQTSDQAIHSLYLSRLYEKLIDKVKKEENNKKVELSKEEKSEIAREVGFY
ncbi:site-specific integrase [Clostridium paraputrificum]|uniref:tyrosine-type recombinase/integrase n=1 Tax=Clostridium paraputrificum TaxID=29363 RepID=UPI00325C1A53